MNEISFSSQVEKYNPNGSILHTDTSSNYTSYLLEKHLLIMNTWKGEK